MSQDLLFVVGVGVFAITVCASLLYGFFSFGRMYEASIVEEATSLSLTDTIEIDGGLAPAITTRVRE